MAEQEDIERDVGTCEGCELENCDRVDGLCVSCDGEKNEMPQRVFLERWGQRRSSMNDQTVRAMWRRGDRMRHPIEVEDTTKRPTVPELPPSEDKTPAA